MEPRLFLARFDCWGVGDLRGFGGGLAGGDGLCLRRGGLAEGENLRVLRGGLDAVLLGGFFGGDREREEERKSYYQIRMLMTVVSCKSKITLDSD